MTPTRILPALILAGLLPVVAACCAQTRPDEMSPTPMSYATLRTNLMAQGYRPLRFPPAEVSIRCFTRAEICTAYPETDACAGTGEGECIFVFLAPGGSYFTVMTRGEALSELQVVRSGRASWRQAQGYRAIPPV